MKEIEAIINAFEIKLKTNKREIAYRRFFTCHYLRRRYYDLTLNEIADMVGYDNSAKHSSVIYAIRQHETLKDDDYYQEVTKSLLEAFKTTEPVVIEVQQKKTLQERVLECGNYWEMVKLQNEIRDELDR